MSLQDYANRKYDYLAFQKVDINKEAQLGLALYDEDTSGKICTGIQKLAQRWALEFLTEQGSMLHLPQRGCEFMTLVRFGRLRNRSDVASAFVAANLTVARNMQLEEYPNMLDDERLGAAELANVSIQPGFIDLRVIIVSRAGNSRAIIVPVETLP